MWKERRTNWTRWRSRLGWTTCSWCTTPRWRSRWGRAPCSSCLPLPMTSGCMGFLPGRLASIQESTSHSDVSYQLNLFWLHVRIWYKCGKLMLTFTEVNDAEHSTQTLLAPCYWSDSMHQQVLKSSPVGIHFGGRFRIISTKNLCALEKMFSCCWG